MSDTTTTTPLTTDEREQLAAEAATLRDRLTRDSHPDMQARYDAIMERLTIRTTTAEEI